MTQDVQQWLTEIQSLQQRLSEVSRERAAAYEQIARWQRAYQTEAQQRRTDRRRLQTVIYRLDQENKRLKQQLDLPPNVHSRFFMSNEPSPVSDDSVSEHGSRASSGSVPERSSQDGVQAPPLLPSSPPDRYISKLQDQLKESMAECDRLAKALSQEQLNHEQTRQTLMTALGDTVEQLERERQRYMQSQSQQGGSSDNERILASQQPESNISLPEKQQKRLAPAPLFSPETDYLP